MPSLRLSVALCTYNGAKFLPEQLRSLAAQSRPADEFIICDDGSADSTPTLLQNFAASSSVPVRIEIKKNPRPITSPSQPLGIAANFARAISLCTGDIIALCDQDDIWRHDKLALIEAAFQSPENPSLVFSDADVCDESGEPLGYRLWNSVRFSRSEQNTMRQGRGIDVLLKHNVITGATLAFASRHRDLLLPIESEWMHDGWIALLLTAVAPVHLYAQPLIRYRQHHQQAIGAPQRTLYQQYKNARAMDKNIFAEEAEKFEAVRRRLSRAGASCHVLNLLEKKIQHTLHRSAIRRRESSRLWAFRDLLTLRYRHFSLGWKSFAQDLFL